jgi:hypothetical protein
MSYKLLAYVNIYPTFSTPRYKRMAQIVQMMIWADLLKILAYALNTVWKYIVSLVTLFLFLFPLRFQDCFDIVS